MQFATRLTLRIFAVATIVFFVLRAFRVSYLLLIADSPIYLLVMLGVATGTGLFGSIVRMFFLSSRVLLFASLSCSVLWILLELTVFLVMSNINNDFFGISFTMDLQLVSSLVAVQDVLLYAYIFQLDHFQHKKKGG